MSNTELNVFVPNGESRTDTAILLVGTADEHGIDQHEIVATDGGFYISDRLADVAFEEAPEADVDADADADAEDKAEAEPAKSTRRSSKKN